MNCGCNLGDMAQKVAPRGILYTLLIKKKINLFKWDCNKLVIKECKISQ